MGAGICEVWRWHTPHLKMLFWLRHRSHKKQTAQCQRGSAEDHITAQNPVLIVRYNRTPSFAATYGGKIQRAELRASLPKSYLRCPQRRILGFWSKGLHQQWNMRFLSETRIQVFGGNEILHGSTSNLVVNTAHLKISWSHEVYGSSHLPSSKSLPKS